MKRANQDIRDLLEKERIYHWEVAFKMGLNSPNFSALLRVELDEEKRKKVLRAINEIRKERLKND